MDLDLKYEDLTMVLCARNMDKQNIIHNVDRDSISFTLNLNSADEMTFDVYKYLDGRYENCWEDIYSLKLIFCPELNEYFEVDVSFVDGNQPKKTLTCTSLCEAELSQINLYNIEINTESDIIYNAYSSTDNVMSTVFYRSEPELKEYSLLHRILDKAPHYHIEHVDSSLQNLQRSFSVSGSSIYSFLTGECAEQFNCLFKFDSTNRGIYVYDLYTVCRNDDCKYKATNGKRYRDDMSKFTKSNGTGYECPYCGKRHLQYFGKDTMVYVDKENLTNEINFSTDTDSIKNAFKISAGDDDMTAAVINQSPSGSDYLYYFCPETKKDMSEALTTVLDTYDEEYDKYQNDYVYTVTPSDDTYSVFENYNQVIDDYRDRYYDQYDTKIDAGIMQDMSEFKIPFNNNKFEIKGYPNIVKYLGYSYTVGSYLKSTMMPLDSFVFESTSVEAESLKQGLSDSKRTFSVNISYSSWPQSSAELAVKNMCKLYVHTGYVKLDIETYTGGFNGPTKYEKNEKDCYKWTWAGKITITSYSDSTDITEVDIPTDNPLIINNEYDTYITGTVEKKLKELIDEDEDDYDVPNYDIYVNKKDGDYTIDEEKVKDFTKLVKKYCSARLQSFSDAVTMAVSVIDELIDDYTNDDSTEEQRKTTEDLVSPIKDAFGKKATILKTEYDLRITDVENVTGTSTTNEETGLTVVEKQGIQTVLYDEVSRIQNLLVFKDYFKKEDGTFDDITYAEFHSFRREDTYENSNYTSTGFTDAEIYNAATEFLEVAQEEIVKAGTPQHSISSSLDNLFILDDFKPLRENCELGNWIRIAVDDEIYRLRLISMGFNMSDLNSIDVQFSDVTVAPGVMSDLQSVIQQAKDQGTSYKSTQKQATVGYEVSKEVNDFRQDGLDASLDMIKTSNTEDITITQNGILLRSYNDILDDYESEQCRMIHNAIVFTDDYWTSASAALGYSTYKYYGIDEDSKLKITTQMQSYITQGGSEDDNAYQKLQVKFNEADTDGWHWRHGYGLNADFVIAGYVYGSQIVGGDIYSKDYDPDKNIGTHFKLNTESPELTMYGSSSINMIGDNPEFLCRNNNKDTYVRIKNGNLYLNKLYIYDSKDSSDTKKALSFNSDYNIINLHKPINIGTASIRANVENADKYSTIIDYNYNLTNTNSYNKNVVRFGVESEYSVDTVIRGRYIRIGSSSDKSVIVQNSDGGNRCVIGTATDNLNTDKYREPGDHAITQIMWGGSGKDLYLKIFNKDNSKYFELHSGEDTKWITNT